MSAAVLKSVNSQDSVGGKDPATHLPQRNSAYVLDQLLAGGLLGSPRSSLEKSEHARLTTTSGPLSVSLPPPAPLSNPTRARSPLSLSHAASMAHPAHSPAELDGPVPLVSAFASGSGPTDSELFNQFDQVPAARLHVARASTDSALDVPGLLPSAFASVAYADAFNPGRWDARPEPDPTPQPGLDLHSIEDSLNGMPAQHTCPCNTQVSISPTLWRHFEPPFRLMVHLGIHTTLFEGEVTLPLGIYSSLNPRVITTGMPTRRFSPYQRRSSSTGIMTRGAAAASSGLHLRKSGSLPLMPSSGPPQRREKTDFSILEVMLLKRDVMTREIRDQWHANHPDIDSGTVGSTPVWPGSWVIDVICRVTDGSNPNIWLKALDRTIAASPEASFIHQFSL